MLVHEINNSEMTTNHNNTNIALQSDDKLEWSSELSDEIAELIELFHAGEPNNIKRKRVYQYIVKKFHGVLGKGIRVKLPENVVAAVRLLYPDDEEKGYMGYRDE